MTTTEHIDYKSAGAAKKKYFWVGFALGSVTGWVLNFALLALVYYS